MQITRRHMMLGTLGTALMLPWAAGAGTRLVGGPAFGSSWRAIVPGHVDRNAVQRRIQDEIAAVDASCSPYRPDSDLSRFNATRGSSWQTLRASVVDVTSAALRMADLTEGYFDPTVGPVVARHGFGPISGRAGSFRDIAVRGSQICRTSPQITLDLCGIAKGYALNRIMQALQSARVGHALVDVGGEVKAIGQHPDGRPWAVAIADPLDRGAVRRIVEPRGLSLATSGHASNGVRGRVHTSHIIDPYRQKPARQDLLSVSVLDRSAMRADALATALCAAGPKAGLALARRLGVPALFLSEPSEQMTGDFEKHVLA